MTKEQDKKQEIQRLLNTLDPERLSKEDFVKAFTTVVDLIKKMQVRNTQEIEQLKKVFKQITQKIGNDTSVTLQDLKKQTNDLFVGDKVSDIDKRLGERFDLSKSEINKLIGEKLEELTTNVSNLKPLKGDPGLTGVAGRTPSKTEIELALKPIIDEFKKEWREIVQRVLNRGRLGAIGPSVITPRPLNNITPTGDINGSNTAYILPKAPVKNGEQVFLNGVRQRSGSSNDYTILAKTITFASAPLTDDIILIDILY